MSSGAGGCAGKFAEVKRAAQALVVHKGGIRSWAEGAGLLMDLDTLLSALEEQEEEEAEDGHGQGPAPHAEVRQSVLPWYQWLPRKATLSCSLPWFHEPVPLE